LLEILDEWGFSDEPDREDYRVAEAEAYYAGLKQRWVVVESDERAERGVKQVEKRVDQEQAKATKGLRALRRTRRRWRDVSGERSAPSRPPTC
jgi:transposase